jgi:hypothetical protein
MVVGATKAGLRTGKALREARSPMESACGYVGAWIGMGAGMFGGGVAAIAAAAVFPPAVGAAPAGMTMGAGAGGVAGAKLGIKIARALSGQSSQADGR